MKKITVLITLIFMLSSCFSSSNDEPDIQPIPGEEFNEMTDPAINEENEVMDDKTDLIEESSTGQTDEGIDDEEKSGTGEVNDSNKTEEEVVEEFEEELDALFDLLEKDE